MYEVYDYVFYPYKFKNCSVMPLQHQYITEELSINLCIIHPRFLLSLPIVCQFFKGQKNYISNTLHFKC